MNKKALLATWYTGTNYGTVLQAYSLYKVLENPKITELKNAENFYMNIEPSLLSYIPIKDNQYKKNKIKEFFIESQKIKKVFRRISKKIFFKDMKKREEYFENFLKSNFNFWPKFTIQKKEDLKELSSIFDYYIIGSDQVWNPNFLDETYLLDWVENDKKRISYAPSLCVNRIPIEKIDKYDLLKKFNSISVRENNETVQQLEKITKKQVSVVVDPVVLLGRKELLKNCINCEKQNYILSYLIGDTLNTRKYCLRFKRKNNLELKSILGINSLHITNDVILKKYGVWNIGPLELIKYIYSSKFIITDSFHVMVLAVLLHKNFTVLSREGGKAEQNNRIINFLKTIKLEDRFDFYPNDIENINIDSEKWNEIDKILDLYREESMEYLKKSIIGDDKLDVGKR